MTRITNKEHLQTFFKYKAAKRLAACFVCDKQDYKQIEFHHLCFETGRITDKFMAVSQMVWANMPWDDIKDELNKCVPMCRCCHVNYHNKLNEGLRNGTVKRNPYAHRRSHAHGARMRTLQA